MDKKIDFVITWVNDKDPKWIKKMNLFSKTLETNRPKDSILRFQDYGTLKFLFRSIERYAPWVNHIYLVTDDQVPSWLNRRNSKVSLVDHKDILPSHILPVFNSSVIELSINKIKEYLEKKIDDQQGHIFDSISIRRNEIIFIIKNYLKRGVQKEHFNVFNKKSNKSYKRQDIYKFIFSLYKF